MDQPPLPPHERPWRHPSELGPNRRELDDGGPGTMTLALATGAVAFVVVAVLVVAIVPPQSAEPLVSVTTAPVAAVGVARSDATAESARARLVSVTRIPNEVSSAGLPETGDLTAADSVPEGDQPVIVLTDEFAYWVEWSALSRLDLPEDSIIVDAGGALVGHVRDGDVVVTIGAD